MPGRVFEGLMGFRFCVIGCSPDKGVVDSNTVVFTSGPVLPRVERLQLIGLQQHSSSKRGPGLDSEDHRQQLFNDHVSPHFKSIFPDSSSCGMVHLGSVQEMCGVNFEISAFEPEAQGWGIVDRHTQIFTCVHPLPEFGRIHVVPFSDTLPSAYEFDVFRDYVQPFFASHRSDAFYEGSTFFHNSVQFKVVAAEPRGKSCRVGLQTEIYSEG